MKTKARAWIENGVIRCCSQMCEVGGVPCPRIEKCREYEVVRLDSLPGFFLAEASRNIGRNRRLGLLERLAETVRTYRRANYVAKETLEKQIDSLLRELNVSEHE